MKKVLLLPAAGRKMDLPLGPVTSLPFTPFWVVQVQVQLVLNSVHSSSVGIRQLPPQFTWAASSSGSSTVLLSTVP